MNTRNTKQEYEETIARLRGLAGLDGLDKIHRGDERIQEALKEFCMASEKMEPKIDSEDAYTNLAEAAQLVASTYDAAFRELDDTKIPNLKNKYKELEVLAYRLGASDNLRYRRLASAMMAVGVVLMICAVVSAISLVLSIFMPVTIGAGIGLGLAWPGRHLDSWVEALWVYL